MEDGNTLKTTVPQFVLNDAENSTFQNITANPGKVEGSINSVEVVTGPDVYIQSGADGFKGGGVGGAFVPRESDSNTDGGKTRTLITVSCVTLSASLVLVVILASLLYKYKTRKVLRASSPLLLSVTLLGTSLVYIECLVLMTASVTHPLVSCIIAQWLYMIGVTLIYGSLGLKTWRVSVILLFYKSRQMHTKDKELVLRLLALLAAVILYLVIWTFLILHDGQIVRREVDACSYRTWGQMVATIGEVGLLVWGAVMCYQARLAPTLYNDSTYIGMAVWNHLIWIVNSVISSYYLETYHNNFLKLLLLFLFTQCTTTTTIWLVFIPKFSAILNKTRILEGTLTDVYGPARVHKLTLVINKTGSVRTISCSPCGPLQDVNDATEHTETSDIRETRETEYSKEEVNALIELVSKLKSERLYYKSQLKTLVTDLKEMKETYGLQSLPWPHTPLLPDTPALHLPEGVSGPEQQIIKPLHNIQGSGHNKQAVLSTFPHAALTDSHPLADRDMQQLKCPMLTITDVVTASESEAANTTTTTATNTTTATSLGTKKQQPSLVTNGHYYPQSFWVANVLGTPGNTTGVGGALQLPPGGGNHHLIRPSTTRDSICTMMTSISLSSPTANLLNVEETNLGLLETLSPSTGYKTEDRSPSAVVGHEQNFLSHGNCNGIGACGRNSPDSSIAQGYDNKGICEWLKHSTGERLGPIPGITMTSASTIVTSSNIKGPVGGNPCLTTSSSSTSAHNNNNNSIQSNSEQQKTNNATNNLNQPPSGNRTGSLCCGVKQKCPVNSILRNNITTGPQRPKSLTLPKRATSLNHNGGYYTKKTNFVFYI